MFLLKFKMNRLIPVILLKKYLTLLTTLTYNKTIICYARMVVKFDTFFVYFFCSPIQSSTGARAAKPFAIWITSYIFVRLLLSTFDFRKTICWWQNIIKRLTSLAGDEYVHDGILLCCWLARFKYFRIIVQLTPVNNCMSKIYFSGG